MKITFRIAIDATGANTFGANYNIRSLLNYFEKSNFDSCHLIFFCSSNSFLDFKNDKITIYTHSFLKNLVFRILFTTIIFPIICLIKRVNIIYSPFDIGPFYSYGIKTILGIKNPNMILPPNLVTLKYPNLHKIVSYLSAFNASVYLFPSQYALNVLGVNFYNNKIKGKFVHHGINFQEWENINFNKSTQDKKYIFFCSILYKFKNIEVLFFALNKINKGKNDNEKINLIICGKFVDDIYKFKIKSLIKDLEIESNVIMYSTLDRNEIINLYRNAELIVIPTLYETFGHMYLEAINSNRPVIVADTLIARELLSDSVIYFPVSDYEVLSYLISNKLYLHDFEMLNNKRIDLLANFSIEKECKETFEILFQ